METSHSYLLSGALLIRTKVTPIPPEKGRDFFLERNDEVKKKGTKNTNLKKRKGNNGEIFVTLYQFGCFIFYTIMEDLRIYQMFKHF